MNGACDRRNPLRRGGTGQDERYRPELDPGFVSIDERSTADLILFAERLAGHLKYYTSDNQADGDWSPFFSRDISATLAGLASLPVRSFLAFHRALAGWLSDDEGRSDGLLSSHFKLLFHLPALLLRNSARYFDLLPRDHALRGSIAGIVRRDLAQPLRDHVAYYKGVLALAAPPINDAALFDDTPLDPADYNTTFDDTAEEIQLPSVVSGRLVGSAAISALDVSEAFISPLASSWSDLFTGVTPEPAPYLDSLGSTYDQVYDAINYNLVAKTFERLFEGIARMAAEAARHLEDSLAAYDAHPAHYGLWLAFLRLFRFNQRHLNEMTGRHLDHYYRDILRLCPRAAEPDRVHLLLELAKGKSERLLPGRETRFKAGKDGRGAEVLYALDSDLVVNRAAVASLKALHAPTFDYEVPLKLPAAYPVADSADGRGAALPKDDPSWLPFGPEPAAPDARFGLAIADRRLFLRDGTRTITVTIQLESAPLDGILPLVMRAALTSEEGWFETTAVTGALHEDTIVLTIELDGEDPAVVPFDRKLHERPYDVATPVLELLFDFQSEAFLGPFFATAALNLLRDVRFTSVTVQASAAGVKRFTLATGGGGVDVSKPFLPFGAQPRVGAPLVVGSSEAFSKPLERLWLHVTWEKTLNSSDYFLKADTSAYTAAAKHLKGGSWESLGGDVYLLDSNVIEIFDTAVEGLSSASEQTLENPEYGRDAASGFVRLELNKDFGHAAFDDQKALALIKAAGGASSWSTSSSYNYHNNGTSTAPIYVPKDPYQPKILDASLSYDTTTGPPAQYFQVGPFGHRREPSPSGRVVPELAHEGALYIGVRDLAPPQRLSMLFQMVDGTANPLKARAEPRWDYLRGDGWEFLEDRFVDDRTEGLSGSGIVAIAVPADASVEHTLMPAGLHWIRMAVEKDADAVNRIRGIHAQAGRATLVAQGIDPGFVATPLAPGTISKLQISNAAIKKIEQPYASFGGRPDESPSQFYVRASERLRHKDRASSMWDYERLVLQNFPSVYRAKAINHTRLERDPENDILADNELKPGHVLVVTVPYTHPGSAVNPLRPYTDKQTIVAIDRFLRARVSPFVRLEVQNPKIEEVRVKFDVGFTPDIADLTFYADRLQAAIIEFLTPWSGSGGRDISFGGQWYKSAIVNFVEEQPYVDYVKDFEMYHRPDIEAAWNTADREVIEATTSRSILVSSDTHLIQPIV